MYHLYRQLTAALAIVMLSDAETSVRAQDQPVEGFILKLAFAKPEFKQGESIPATLVLSNTLPEGRPTATGAELNCYDIVVLGPSGDIFPRGPQSILFSHGCFGWLQPFDSHIVKFQLNPPLFDLSEPGDYVVTVSCSVPVRESETYRVENLLGREVKVPTASRTTTIQSTSQVIRIVATTEASQAQSAPLEASNPEFATSKSFEKPNQAFVRNHPGPESKASTSSRESTAAVLAGSVSSTSGSFSFTPVRKTGIAILAALLALLLGILWRAARRKREG